MAYDDLVAKFTLAGSMTSCIATSFVLLSYLIFRDQQHSFRHALILNLALAGTLHPNANDVSLSGVSHRPLESLISCPDSI